MRSKDRESVPAFVPREPGRSEGESSGPLGPHIVTNRERVPETIYGHLQSYNNFLEQASNERSRGDLAAERTSLRMAWSHAQIYAREYNNLPRGNKSPEIESELPVEMIKARIKELEEELGLSSGKPELTSVV